VTGYVVRRRLAQGARRLALGAKVFTLAGLTALGACQRTESAPEVAVRFGVFFGGQVQEREKIPLVVDRARQTIGIRLEFASPPVTEQNVRWELDKPAPGKTPDGARVVAYGEVKTRPGAAVLDLPLAFQAADRPGAWRIRVALDGRRVLDRPFTVTPASDASAEE
jgi:hypothetical protein